MFSSILSILYYIFVLIFGVYVAASFLDLKLIRRNTTILLLFCACILLLEFTIYSIFGYDKAEAFYPLIAHLPLVLLFVIIFKKSLQHSLYSVLAAYLCCQISKWIGILAEALTGEKNVNTAFRIVFLFISAFLIIRYISPSIVIILSKSKKAIYIFSILPIVYYVFDYCTTVYTNWLYEGKTAVFEFLPFILCISYFAFCIIYFKTYEESCEAERYKQLMEMQRNRSEKELETIKRSEFAASLLRHDMRHFLNNISTMIEKNDIIGANRHIHEIIAAIDRSAVKRYCSNEIVNLIISSYESIIIKNDIQLELSVRIPDKLPLSDIDITSILSNGLENAIHAVLPLSLEKRRIYLYINMENNKLLISIKNTFANECKMVNSLPVTDEPGHGLGTQSIRYVTEKLKGHCQFIVKDDLFILQIVI